MDYFIGVILAFAISFIFGTVVGFDRSRAFYPVVMIVIASYYALFALMGGDAARVGVGVCLLCRVRDRLGVGLQTQSLLGGRGIVCTWHLRFLPQSFYIQSRPAGVVARVVSCLRRHCGGISGVAAATLKGTGAALVS